VLTKKNCQRLDREYGKLSTKFDRLATQLIDQTITLSSFEEQIAIALKASTLYAYSVAANGKPTQSHWGSSGWHLRTQYAALHDFAVQIKNGEVSEKQLRSRVDRYAASIRVAANRSEKITQIRSGKVYATRVLDVQAKHCPECPGYATSKPVPIDKIIPTGVNCSCRERCRCRVIYIGNNKDAIEQRLEKALKIEQKIEKSSPTLEQIEKLFFGKK
jgi:hypothetical protein